MLFPQYNFFSAVQHGDPLHIPIYTHFSHITMLHHKWLDRVLNAIQQDLTANPFQSNSFHLLNPQISSVYSIVLISAVQHSDPDIYIYIYIHILSHTIFHHILSQETGYSFFLFLMLHWIVTIILSMEIHINSGNYLELMKNVNISHMWLMIPLQPKLNSKAHSGLYLSLFIITAVHIRASVKNCSWTLLPVTFPLIHLMLSVKGLL